MTEVHNIDAIDRALFDVAEAGSGQSGLALALECAGRVAAATDRRALEAAALSAWLAENGAQLGLAEDDIPDDETRLRSCWTKGVAEPTWQRLCASLAAARAAAPSVANVPATLWLAAFAARLGFDPLEQGILSLAIHYDHDRRLERLIDMLCSARGLPEHMTRNPRLIGLLLAASPTEIEARLAKQGRLLGSGLLRIGRNGALETLQPLLDLLRLGEPPGEDIYDQLLGRPVPAALPWDAFAHLGPEAAIAADLLRAALRERAVGVNLLLYGPPGTGKTSFAATLAARIGAELRPVVEQDQQGGEPNRHERLSGLLLGQRLAPAGDTLLLFDEAEDVFVPRSLAYDEPVVTSRVFMHRALEQNTVPVIWTANEIGVLGPAVLRRMTMCLKLGVPGVAVRTRLWCRMGEAEGVPLPEADAARLARLVPAAPALASTALRATRLAGGGAATARLIVEGIARAVAGGRMAAPEPESHALYDPALVNADRDLQKLTAGLLRPGAPRAMSILLSGPPGAGKSAWVRHLAARMGLEVLQKRASDLLDPFVGGTEQRIAAAFAEARQEGAFLVFDEADSLLGERGDAVRSWEISQVNEMLTWMEQHPLPFACTTNLPDRLDRASLRRFLVKLRFDWLTTTQAVEAFRRFFGMDPPPGIEAMRTLTPADFALVSRRAALTDELGDAAAVLALLAAECEDRVGARPPIGFAGVLPDAAGAGRNLLECAGVARHNCG